MGVKMLIVFGYLLKIYKNDFLYITSEDCSALYTEIFNDNVLSFFFFSFLSFAFL